MSTELKSSYPTEYKLRRFYGGTERGLCLEVTSVRARREYTIPQLNIVMYNFDDLRNDLGLTDDIALVRLITDLTVYLRDNGDSMVMHT